MLAWVHPWRFVLGICSESGVCRERDKNARARLKGSALSGIVIRVVLDPSSRTDELNPTRNSNPTHTILVFILDKLSVGDRSGSQPLN